MDYVLDTAFVLAAVAFFKERLGLKGWYVIGAALVATLAVAFIPELLAAFPLAAPYLEKIIRIIELFLLAPGLFDLAVDVGKKISDTAYS